MRIIPKNYFERAIKLKETDKEIWNFVTNLMALAGIYTGIFIALTKMMKFIYLGKINLRENRQ